MDCENEITVLKKSATNEIAPEGFENWKKD